MAAINRWYYFIRQGSIIPHGHKKSDGVTSTHSDILRSMSNQYQNQPLYVLRILSGLGPSSALLPMSLQSVLVTTSGSWYSLPYYK